MLDHFASLLAKYVPCSVSVAACFETSQSPPLSPMQGELDGLLNDQDRWRDEMDEAVSLHSTGGKSSPWTPARKTGYLANHMSLFGRSPRSTSRKGHLPAYTLRSDQFASVVSDNESENPDADGHSGLDYDANVAGLERATHQLPELAKRFEPQLTLEDIAREEAEQERRERLAERASGLENCSSPALEEDGDGFGDFEQGPGEHSNSIVRPETGSDSDEDAAEVSFGLGTTDD